MMRARHVLSSHIWKKTPRTSSFRRQSHPTDRVSGSNRQTSRPASGTILLSFTDVPNLEDIAKQHCSSTENLLSSRSATTQQLHLQSSSPRARKVLLL